jgi:hypothetical protein
VTTTPVEWLDRARVAEARVAELEEQMLHFGDLAQEDRDRLAGRLEELEAELARVRAATLEECAKVADDIADEFPDAPRMRHEDWRHGWQDGSMNVASAIRALGESDAPSISAQIRAATLEECAELAQEFGWTLELRETAEMNEAMDDAACDVARQIAEAIRAKAASDG